VKGEGFLLSIRGPQNTTRGASGGKANWVGARKMAGDIGGI